MTHPIFLAVVMASVGMFCALAEAAEKGLTLNPERIKAIAVMLPERPVGLGPLISDRATWDALAKTPPYQAVIRAAEKLLREPLPDQPDDLYLDLSRTGNRTRWQAVAGKRRGRMAPLVLAECAQNQGRFIPAIEQLIEALCAERTWVFPAHDRSLADFNGKTVTVDLYSSRVGWEMATAQWLLGDRLKPSIRPLIADNLEKRLFVSYRPDMDGRRRNGWTTATHNWNAVCLAGVTGTALATIDSRDERARYVAAAEEFSKNFLAGFTPDGYCSEGLGYWNYGFGHYVLLAETVRQATGGKIDWMARPEVRAPASFPARIQIINGVAPAFADCSVRSWPAGTTMWFVNHLLGLGLKEYDSLNMKHTAGMLFEELIYRLPNAASQAQPPATRPVEIGLRSWFDRAGILIGRPTPGRACRMGVALKGGHNAEHHNHNDVGSYVVVVGDRAVLLDPGSEVYTARTFSAHRYDSKVLNSFGHAVPLVAGQLQKPGRDAAAKILGTEFTDAADTLKMDIRSAYPVKELSTLERTFVYHRDGTGSLSVSDRVQFSTPQAFGTALITAGSWKQLEDGTLLVQDGKQAVQVKIAASGGETAVSAEEIHEDTSIKPIRIGINFTKPVAEGTITVTITPAEAK